MRLRPISLFGRLLLLSGLATAVALAVAGWAIGGVLERFAMRGLDDRLDAQMLLLADAVRADGGVDPAALRRLPGFAADEGWAWRITAADGRRWTSGRAIPAAPPLPPPPPDAAGRPPPPPGRPRPGEGRDADGRRVHARTMAIETAAGPVTITAAAPRDLADRPIRAALAPLLLSLLLLGGGLAAAALLQLRLGLKPLRDLHRAIAAVRGGRAARVPAEQPIELRPLVTELNALLDENEAGLAHARTHVANLAHGLKTPLAALIVRLEEPGRDPDGALRRLAEGAAARIRHHLGRARAAAGGAPARRRVELAPLVADLAAVLARLHAARPVAAAVDVPPDLAVAADGEDVSEMLGNLLDNAWAHAATRVTVQAAAEGATVTIAIEDDGPGLTDTEQAAALMPGRRLDERGDGHGFGLPIARELAELSGGGLMLTRGGKGGLRAMLTLPRA
ncbi:MAG: HAMP domain-containing sensor histidine kinase [Sphingomonas fennica]